MYFTPSRTRATTLWRRLILHTTWLLGNMLILNVVCFAQSTEPTTSGSAALPQTGNKPLTADEREELLKLIRNLQERLDKLEAAQAAQAPASPAQGRTAGPTPLSDKPDPSTSEDPHVWMAP